MSSVNRRSLLGLGVLSLLSACGGGADNGDETNLKLQDQTVFGFNLYDYLGQLMADPNTAGVHFLGAATYNRTQSGFQVYRITSPYGVPLLMFDITPGDGHWYRLHYLTSIGSNVYEAWVASSAGSAARVVGFGPGTHTNYGGNYGVEVYGPSGPAGGALFSTNAGPLALDQAADFAGTPYYSVDPYSYPPGTVLDQTALSFSSTRVGVLGEGQSSVLILQGGSPYILIPGAYRVQSGYLQRVLGPQMVVGPPNAGGDSAFMYKQEETVLAVDLSRYL